MQPPQEEGSSALQRYLALKQLREYMFYANPEKYSYTDIAEDLPDNLKPIGHMLKNVLPSAAIIEQDPAKRKSQIDQAIQKIKSTTNSKEGLGKEMLHNAISMGKASLIPSALLGLALGRFGLRLPRPGKWLPFEARNIGRLFSKQKAIGAGARAALRKELMTNMASGAGFAALSGAAYPMFAAGSKLPEKSLEEARKIMERQPYLTSLPTSELLASIKEQSSNAPQTTGDKAKNVALGTGLGAGLGAAGAIIPTLSSVALGVLTRGKLGLKGSLASAPVRNKLLRSFLRDVKMNAGLGAVGGAVSGVLGNNYIQDEYENVKNQVAETDKKPEKPPEELAMHPDLAASEPAPLPAMHPDLTPVQNVPHKSTSYKI